MTRFALIGLFLIGLIAIVYTLISAAGGKPQNNPLEAYAQGQMEKLTFPQSDRIASSEPFSDVNGNPVRLTDFAGQTLLVNFWATWCPPCEKEMPSIAALEKARGGETFKVIVISVDASGDTEYAQKRLTELGAAQLDFYMSPSDEGMRAAYAAGVSGFPTTVLYSATGRELARLTGEADWASLEAVNFIDVLIETGR